MPIDRRFLALLIRGRWRVGRVAVPRMSVDEVEAFLDESFPQSRAFGSRLVALGEGTARVVLDAGQHPVVLRLRHINSTAAPASVPA